ncbi:hypothetical protein GPALN_005388 [Globodera pallida]|nr:hypothetical protein GPALN_005388 [Globodera pallida]
MCNRSQKDNALTKLMNVAEVMLDVLKFLNYYESCQMESTSNLFRLMVNRYRNELALCSFYQIQLIPEPAVSLTSYRRAFEITEDFYHENGPLEELPSVEEMENEGWTRLLDQKLPLFAFPDASFALQIQHDAVDSYLLFITKEDDGKPKLCLELPLYAESAEDLSLIRFWLLQLSRVHFWWMDLGRFFFNPEMVSALLSPSKNARSLRSRPFDLHSHQLSLKVGVPDELHNGRFLRFVSTCVTTGYLTLRCGIYFEGILDLLLKNGSRIGSVVVPVGPVHSTVELQNLIIYHAENALNPLTMVGTIEFHTVDDFPWPDLRSSKCLGRTVENDLTHSKYSLSNSHLPNVRFTVTIGHLHGSNEFKRFSIQRIVDNPKESVI